MNILKKLKLDIIFLGIDCPVHFNKARRTKLVQNSATPNHNNNYSMGYSYTDIFPKCKAILKISYFSTLWRCAAFLPLQFSDWFSLLQRIESNGSFDEMSELIPKKSLAQRGGYNYWL